jgi:hypothetical protein
MATKKNQAAVFNFLLDHFRSQGPFTESELEEHTNWRSSTSNLSHLLTQIPFALARHLDPIRHGKASALSNR